MKKEQLYYILRNLTRKTKQTIFTVLCISISSLIIFANIAFNNGIQHKLKQGINEAVSGQLTVYKANKKGINILESQLKDQQRFDWSAKSDKQLLGLSPGISVKKRIRFGSLVSFNNETSYVNVHALDTGHLNKLAQLIKVRRGTFPKRNDGILISESLAKELHCKVADTILLVAENTNRYMSDNLAVVSGVFDENGLASFFGRVAFVPYHLGETITQVDTGEALELIVNSRNGEDVSGDAMKKINAYVIGGQKLQIASWDKTIPLLFKIVKVWKAGGYFTQIVFVLFSMVILVNFSTIIIESRKKEFGSLLAIGFSWKSVFSLVCLEYLVITIFSVALSYVLFRGITSFLPPEGVYIGSRDMQSALMTESIAPFLTSFDFLYVMFLFVMTIVASISISILKVKKLTPLTLINS
jgi:ABC-type lipoprotein release transport system permease subunit